MGLPRLVSERGLVLAATCADNLAASPTVVASLDHVEHNTANLKMRYYVLTKFLKMVNTKAAGKKS